MDYTINYNDQRFQDVKNEEQQQLNNLNNTYNTMVNDSNQFYQDQIKAAEEYGNKQQELQQQGTDLAIEQINNAKSDATKDYEKEQKAAYTDWQKQSNQYGANAEQMATQGLANTGYSESSQVAMYNQYQNRVSIAREDYNKAIRDYDMAIKDAQLQNNSALAEIAYKSLQTKLELSLQGFQYKNTLLIDQLDKQQNINNIYNQRWQNVLSQINTENALAEQVRQYNADMAEKQRQYDTSLAEQQRQFAETMAYKKEQDAQAQSNWEKEYALSLQSLKAKSSGGSSGGSSKTGTTNPYASTNGGSNSNSNVKANPYTGTVNPDAKKGTMDNGYQPDNVGGSKLSNSGMKVKDIYTGAVGSSGISLMTQSVWQTNGRYYVWDGSINDYIDVTNDVKTSKKDNINVFWNW